MRKLGLSVGFIIAVMIIATVLRAIARVFTRGERRLHARFVAQQVVSIISTLLIVIVLVSIWFDNPSRFASAAALITAGLTIALQKFVMAFVGYFAILRGHTFKVGDRITMGGVRGDVIGLGYIRTTIMEMGQPPEVQSQADPAMWIEARQYTGRIVSVTNDKIFDMPVYNFTREFPYLFEEMRVPVKYGGDRAAAERILLDAAKKHTVKVDEISEADLKHLRDRYFLRPTDDVPCVYLRLTDNWIELTVRFIVREYGIRGVKNAISRDILEAFDKQNIQIASSTMDVTLV
jgi:small-conductance mechanosensitive channel